MRLRGARIIVRSPSSSGGAKRVESLSGGIGADRFRIALAADSTPLATDSVADFTFAGGDRIDLSFIDADSLAANDQAFIYIGSAAFSGGGALSAGQLRVTLTSPGQWRAQGDINGDGAADLQIDITSATGPGAGGWFIL